MISHDEGVQVCSRCEGENPDDGRFCSYCGLTLTAKEPSLVRRTATMVFVDLVGSTALGESLDPEALTTVLRRYFAVARRSVERHGGTIMKFIGDAVVAVFGLPISHEDDPLRAIRATLDLLHEVETLNVELRDVYGVELQLRAGVNTGEVAGDGNALEESFVFGDTANTAARLEQHAPTGGILLGEKTFRAAGVHVEADEVDAIAAKGKSAPVRAFRLVSVNAVEHSERPLSASPIIGRTDELAFLSDLFTEALTSGVRAVTLVGEPGLGKSRLASEFVARLPPGSRALSGRCPSYGEGVAYWAIREMAVQAADLESSASLLDIGRALRGLGGERDVEIAVARLSSAFGFVDQAPSSVDFAWGVETLVRHLASSSPLVLVFDDIHWAGTGLLNVIERLANGLDDVPVMIVCTSRSELLETHPDWAQRTRGHVLALDPLDAENASLLIGELLGGQKFDPGLENRVRSNAGGNPLFLEQTIRMLSDEGMIASLGSQLVDSGGALAAVPTTLGSLLDARLDQLTTSESGLLSRAAVFGAEFGIDDLVALDADRSAEEIASIVDRMCDHDYFERRAQLFAFRHLLIRDAAYERLTKSDRSKIHERAVARLEHVEEQDATQLDELIGFHLEQAFLSRTELKVATGHDAELATAAADRLSRAGRHAARRGDVDAAASLMNRAVDLIEDNPLRARLLVEIAAARLEGGWFDLAEEALGRAESDPLLDADSRLLLDVCRDHARLQVGSAGGAWARDAHERALTALERFSQLGDHAAVLEAGWLVVLTSTGLGESSVGRAAIDQLALAASKYGDPHTGRLPGMLAMNLAWGPTPIPEALQATSELLELVTGDPSAEPMVLAHHAYLLALSGDIDSARSALGHTRDLLERQGQRLMMWGAWSQGVGRVELEAGDPARAVAATLQGFDELSKMGERAFATTLAGYLAQALIRTGRHDEASPYVDACRRDAGEADVLSQILWRVAQAELDQAQQPEKALRLVDEALELALATEWPNIQGQVQLSAARVRAGHRSSAASAAR